MHTHSNVGRVTTELFMILLGLPVFGFISALILWRRATRNTGGDDSQSVSLGLRSIAFPFAAYLIWLGLTSVPPRYHSGFSVLLLILLSISGTVAAGSGLVLVLLHARGSLRICAAILAMLGLAYAVASSFDLLAGGGAPG